jgi:hypothetical protein
MGNSQIEEVAALAIAMVRAMYRYVVVPVKLTDSIVDRRPSVPSLSTFSTVPLALAHPGIVCLIAQCFNCIEQDTYTSVYLSVTCESPKCDLLIFLAIRITICSVTCIEHSATR